MKEESEKAGLKLNIQKTKIMTFSPIISWQVGGKTMETSTDFIFLGSKITADGDSSNEIKRCLFLGRKAWQNSILKSRDKKKQGHYFANKGSSSQSYGFSSSLVWIWEWTIKKAEHWRIDAFELWCWRRHLRVPWTARRSNQSILKEINPEYFWKDWCWSWNSNTLATCCEEPTYWKRPWCWERLKTGEEDDRGWDG